MARSQMRAKIRERGAWVPAMPNLLTQVAERGVEFNRYYASDPICGPSRASLLTGLATHNHGMKINVAPWGYPLWQDSPISSENLPNWLSRDGYRTIHIGKYTNGYGATEPEEVPSGWDRWITPTKSSGASYYGSPLNIDGQVTRPIGNFKSPDPKDCRVALPAVPGACKHATDLQTAFAVREIGKSSGDDKPFYLQLDYNAPHEDGRPPSGAMPPSRLRGLAAKVKFPKSLKRSPVNSSQPVFIRTQKPLTGAMKRETRKRWGNEVASLRGVDEGIGRVLGQLRRTGQLENTYVIFISDNGIFHGQHRIAYGKFLPHQPSSSQPLLLRGPALPSGRVSDTLTSNLDLASTVLAMTGAKAGRPLDGRSLLGLARHPDKTSRVPVLLEGFNGLDSDEPEPFLDGSGRSRPNQAPVLNYTGFVAGKWKFVQYSYGEEELYNLRADPLELRNRVKDPRRAKLVTWARAQTDRLATCSGPECRLPVNLP